MNTFMNQLRQDTNYKNTENGAVAHKSTNSAVYDLFALGAAYRNRTNEDCILLFKNAFEENQSLALKCLFWIRDCRGGAGERRFFRVAFRWLALNYPSRVENLVSYLPEYGRYDDLFSLLDTPLENCVIDIIKRQLSADIDSESNGISLISKWLPSENASNSDTIARARKIRKALNLTSKQYRQMLSKLRTKVNVLEKLMSANEWDKIEFDKIPSRAGVIYKNAFARRDIIAKKYKTFIMDNNTKVNASVLYPYEIVHKAIRDGKKNEVIRETLNKYWKNLPDYLDGKECKLLCVIDTSFSMTSKIGGYSYNTPVPIDAAISLGMYCAERIQGPFKDHFITFSRRPHLVKIEGIDFVDKADRIFQNVINDNTNLTAVFDLLLKTIKRDNVKVEDVPETIVIISDMEIDRAFNSDPFSFESPISTSFSTDMENLRLEWEKEGIKFPRLVYWNVDARNNTILDLGPNVSLVSGLSSTIFKSILSGKNGYDLMIETITTERYKNIE